MVSQKVWARLRPAATDGRLRVVPYRPVWRAIMLAMLGFVTVGAFGFGYWLGAGTAVADRDYLNALEALDRGAEARIHALTQELVDARLAQSVDAQAAQSLRATLSALRDELAGLKEEISFYKNLMAPESVPRGLQIAEFELSRTEAEDRFSYRVLLTQAEVRKGWLEGTVEIQIQGLHAGADGSMVEEVLPLTVLTQTGDYPLRFRFRYFQDLSGTVTLPEGFHPRSVLITASPNGEGAEGLNRSFGWVVQAE